jgi:hypothetical protein
MWVTRKMKKRIEEVYLIALGYTSDILWKILQVYEYAEKYNKKKGKDKKMGYDLHITRASHWSDNEKLEITLEEFKQIVEQDPELEADKEDHTFINWRKEGVEASWLWWRDGDIFTKNPDPPTIEKMISIAKKLNARVQGDDGEIYISSTDVKFPSQTYSSPEPSGKDAIVGIAIFLLFSTFCGFIVIGFIYLFYRLLFF